MISMALYDGDEEDPPLAKIVLPNATGKISPSLELEYAKDLSSSSAAPYCPSSSQFPLARLRADL
jgi:hypothetical protein